MARLCLRPHQPVRAKGRRDQRVRGLHHRLICWSGMSGPVHLVMVWVLSWPL
jgi:hypothetical protein